MGKTNNYVINCTFIHCNKMVNNTIFDRTKSEFHLCRLCYS